MTVIERIVEKAALCGELDVQLGLCAEQLSRPTGRSESTLSDFWRYSQELKVVEAELLILLVSLGDGFSLARAARRTGRARRFLGLVTHAKSWSHRDRALLWDDIDMVKWRLSLAA